MEISNKGLSLIKKFEGFRNHPHLKGDIPTIGYGTTHYNDHTKVQMTDEPITINEAKSVLKTSLNGLGKYIEGYLIVDLNQNQMDALISLVSDVGIYRVAFSEFFGVINSNPNDEIIKEEFKKMSSKKALIKRRNSEAYLYFTKEEENGKKI